jgi:hypothetical protein
MALVLNGDGAIAGLTAGGLPDASVTQADLAANIAGNGPAFSCTMSANQNLTGTAYTVLQFNTEEFDTANCFDTSTYRFTPNIAGYYAISGAFSLSSTGVPLIYVYKNGTGYKRGTYTFSATLFAINMSCLVYFNGTTDYVQLIGRTESNSTVTNGTPDTWFQGYMVRAA